METSQESHTGQLLKNILDATFRANPRYSLLLVEQLPPADQEILASLEEDEDFYGLLHPAGGSNLGIKGIDQETALLFYTLQQPGKVPRYIRRRFGVDCNDAMAKLVLDGVLEVAPAGSAEFVSGAAAYALLSTRPAVAELTDSFIAQLSEDALRYAQALPLTGRQALSTRLYTYNTVPVTAAWRRKLPDPTAIANYLALTSGSKVASLLSQYWLAVENEENEGWLFWSRRRLQGGLSTRYKIYISPAPAALPEVWPAIVSALTASPALAFKIGATVYGLLRPDKIVAYYASFEALITAVTELKASLPDCPAQGVPFTAGIDPAGLLSWGMDPPVEAGVFGWQGRESWRLWITNRLAVALLDAKMQPTDIPPWQFALERLRLEGVDTGQWAPRQSLWREQENG